MNPVNIRMLLQKVKIVLGITGTIQNTVPLLQNMQLAMKQKSGPPLCNIDKLIIRCSLQTFRQESFLIDETVSSAAMDKKVLIRYRFLIRFPGIISDYR
jgi:hypothetical protein